VLVFKTTEQVSVISSTGQVTRREIISYHYLHDRRCSYPRFEAIDHPVHLGPLLSVGQLEPLEEVDATRE
jgi:hypothetical protein